VACHGVVSEPEPVGVIGDQQDIITIDIMKKECSIFGIGKSKEKKIKMD
jgi:hypothetical protein